MEATIQGNNPHYPPIMENQTEKNMENEMETRECRPLT